MRNLIPLNSSCFWVIWIKDHTKMLSPWHWWTWKNHNADHSSGQEEDMKYTRNVCITNIMNKCREIYIYIYTYVFTHIVKNQGAPSILSANLSQKTARMDPLSWSEHGIGSYSLPNPSTELEKTEATNAWLWGWLCQHKLKAFTRLVNSFSRTLNSHHVFMFSSGPVLHTFVWHNIVSLMSSLVSLMSLPPTVPAVSHRVFV